jgi:BolA protein
MASQTPVEDTIREKVPYLQSLGVPFPLACLVVTNRPLFNQITSALQPSRLEIHNDSHLHAHHKAMAGSTSRETHFRVIITSDAFKSKMQPARHRLVYSLLKDEMAKEGGIHALQLRTMTSEEEERRRAAEAAEE